MLSAMGLNASVSEINNLSTTDLQSALNQNSETILINVLPKIIFDNKHIKGSINVPLGHLASIDDFVKEKSAPIIFYCMGRL
jgi:rhodanese-related sulfurtransferase